MKKEFSQYFLLIAVGIIFFIMSVLVFVTKGNRNLIKYKLKMGAVLLNLTWVLSNCTVNGPDGGVSCYEPIRVNTVLVINPNFDAENFLFINSSKRTILLKIKNRTGENFSCRICDTSKSEVFRGNVLAKDGKYDSISETVEIKLNALLPIGKYNLYIFDIAQEKQMDLYYHLVYNTLFKLEND